MRSPKIQLFSREEMRRLAVCKNRDDQIRVLGEIREELIESAEYKKLKPLTPEEENSLRQFAEILLDRAIEEEAKVRKKRLIRKTNNNTPI